jgi:hypothetical protein
MAKLLFGCVLLWVGGLFIGLAVGTMAMGPTTGNELIKSGFTIVDDQGRIVDKFDDAPFTRSYTTTTP